MSACGRDGVFVLDGASRELCLVSQGLIVGSDVSGCVRYLPIRHFCFTGASWYFSGSEKLKLVM